MVHLLAAAVLAVAPAPAHASVAAIARDCANDGQLTRHYRAADLARAHRRLPVDIAEYTNCDNLIVAQRARVVGRRATGSPARECAAKDTLRHRYSAARLRAALRHRLAGDCRMVLRAQLVGWTKPVWPTPRRRG
jgi:hypothetical protein